MFQIILTLKNFFMLETVIIFTYYIVIKLQVVGKKTLTHII